MKEKENFSILIIEDEMLVAESISAILEDEGYMIAGIADHAEAAVAAFNQSRPDLVICDIHLKKGVTGIEISKTLAGIRRVPFIYLTAYADNATLQQALKTEFDAYLLKPVIQVQLIVAVHLALSKFYLQPGLQDVLPPSNREKEILKLVAAGKSSSEIATELHLSVHTVNTHRKNLMNKYEVQSGAELIALALKQHWIS
jgi:DNA-binding NarL/FixJ family response regulator